MAGRHALPAASPAALRSARSLRDENRDGGGSRKKLIKRPERLFALRLGKQTGRLDETPEQILDSLTPAQFAELVAFDRLEGIDQKDRFDRLESILAIGFAALSNLQIVKGQKVEPADFVPAHRWRIQRRKPKPAASVAAQKAALRQIAATHNRARR